MDQQAFYKIEQNELIFGKYIVFPDHSELRVELKDTYTYPINDWYYFDTEKDARLFFNLPIGEETIEDD